MGDAERTVASFLWDPGMYYLGVVQSRFDDVEQLGTPAFGDDLWQAKLAAGGGIALTPRLPPPPPLPARRRHLRQEEPRLAPLPVAVRPQAQARALSGAAGAAHLAGRRGRAPVVPADALAAAQGRGAGA